MESAVGLKAPRLSPDGTRVALRKFGRADGIYVHLLPDGPETWLSPSPDTTRISPALTPDGSNVVFSAQQESGSWRLESIRIDQPGAPDVLLDAFDSHIPSWGPDGKSFAFAVRVGPEFQGGDIWRVDAEGVPHVFLDTEFNEGSPRLSPNGRWVAYVSDQPGEDRVYVQTFPEATENLWVSPGYGTEPVWSRDGRELFYRNATSLMTLPVGGGDEFAYDAPVELFSDVYSVDSYESGIPNYDVSLDGQRFLMSRRVRGEGVLHLVQNWFEELQRLVPVD